MVEEDVKVEAVGGVALQEAVQEVAQLGGSPARNPAREGNDSVILHRGCVSRTSLIPHLA